MTEMIGKAGRCARMWIALVGTFACCGAAGAREMVGSSGMDAPSCGYTALAVGLGTPIALPWGNGWDVCGLQLNLAYGECRFLRGVQIAGVANVAVCEMRGVQAAGLFDYVPNDAWGWQFALGGTCARRAFGLQTALGINYTEELNGVQIGLVNYAEKCPGGFQVGLVNVIMDNRIPLVPFLNLYF